MAKPSPATTPMSLEEIYNLAYDCLIQNGANEANATAVARTLHHAERDGSHSHGLFRLPAYVTSLRSGKVKGDASPKPTQITPAVIRLHGDNGYTPLSHQVGLPLLAETASNLGVAVLTITHTHHMAALWPEVEFLAERGLVGLACTPYMPAVAPAGATEALFGTNPISFAWPRPNDAPIVYDMATASMAMGEVQIAIREGHDVPMGTGLNAKGEMTTKPSEIAEGGVLLPFGGYKGSAIALMVELLAAGLVGENFSFEAKEGDSGDGGPPQGGQFILALSPEIISAKDYQDHCEGFFTKLTGLKGVRLPGERRHQNRRSDAPREINAALVEKIRGLLN